MLGLLGDSKRKQDIEILIASLRNRIKTPNFLPALHQKKILLQFEQDLIVLHEKKISSSSKRAELKKILFQYYLDAYLDERKPNVFSKAIELGNILKFFEEALAECGFVKATDVKASEMDTRDFITLATLKEDIAILTMHAFKRGMKEGFTGTRDSKRIFVNAMNAVVRMGENAVNIWNKDLATKINSDTSLHLIPKKDTEGKNRKETQLEDLHEHLKRDVQFLQVIRTFEI